MLYTIFIIPLVSTEEHVYVQVHMYMNKCDQTLSANLSVMSKPLSNNNLPTTNTFTNSGKCLLLGGSTVGFSYKSKIIE